MDWTNIQKILQIVQHSVSFIGILIITSGILLATVKYIYAIVSGLLANPDIINTIRVELGRIVLLGLEFIVAADLIGSITTPDYYGVGILAIIVIIRTILSYSISREIMSLSKQP